MIAPPTFRCNVSKSRGDEILDEFVGFEGFIVDFIERLFGFAPDNGDGSTEILWLVVLALLIATITYFRVQKRKARQNTIRR